MAKRKASQGIPGTKALSAQGKSSSLNEEMANEPLSAMEKMNNKKRKKNK